MPRLGRSRPASNYLINPGVAQLVVPPTGAMTLSLSMAGTATVTYVAGFPNTILPVKVELLLNGVWTDISTYVYTRNPITITRGRPDETTQIQPGQLTLTLNNQDSRFSPKNSGSPYYPYIGRNTQIRLSVVAATSIASVQYTGYRFWGEVSNWPPQWDQSGRDIYVSIQAGGILRRYVQGRNLGSSLRRFYLLKTDATAPVSYWPCEDGSGSAQFVNLIVDGDDMIWGATAPTLSSDSDFLGSDPLPLVSLSTWTGSTGDFTTTSNTVLRFLLDMPADSIPTDGTVLVRGLIASGSLTYMECYFGAASNSLGFRGFNGATKEFDSGAAVLGVNGVQLMVSMELATSGSNIAWKIDTIQPGGGSSFANATGTYSTATIGPVDQVVVAPNGGVNDTCIGHVVVQSGLENLTAVSAAINGHNGELAGNRFIRLAAEEGFGGVVLGSVTDTPQMGPQIDDLLINLLQDIEDCDRGQLLEARDMLGMYYRTRVSLQNQTPGLVIDYSKAQLAGSLQPTYDDMLTRNDVGLTRPGGSTVVVQLLSGALSIQDPPNGVGDYNYTEQSYVFQDSQLFNLASWIVTIGTIDEYRYPVIEVDLTRTEVAGEGLFDNTPELDVGDYVQIINPPTQVPENPVKQLCWGFTENLGQYTWDIQVNAVPESPYEGSNLPVW